MEKENKEIDNISSDVPAPSPDEPKFDDGQDYVASSSYGKNEISFRDITMQSLGRILTLTRVDWQGGYWQTKIQHVAGVTIESKVYVSDTREIFGNAIEGLANFLFPHFDDDMKKLEEDISKKKDEIKKKESKLDDAEYKGKMLKCNLTLFRNLCSFIKKKGYFESTFLEDK